MEAGESKLFVTSFLHVSVMIVDRQEDVVDNEDEDEREEEDRRIEVVGIETVVVVGL